MSARLLIKSFLPIQRFEQTHSALIVSGWQDFGEMIREGLNVGTVPIFKMHNVGTVPTFEMYNIGTAPMFKMHNVGTNVLDSFLFKFGLH